jgi:hypothetical protein
MTVFINVSAYYGKTIGEYFRMLGYTKFKILYSSLGNQFLNVSDETDAEDKMRGVFASLTDSASSTINNIRSDLNNFIDNKATPAIASISNSVNSYLSGRTRPVTSLEPNDANMVTRGPEEDDGAQGVPPRQ